MLAQAYSYTWTLMPLPPSLPLGPSPGVGPMDGLGVLVTGFTKATASLGTCPHHKRVLRGALGRGQRQGQQLIGAADF